MDRLSPEAYADTIFILGDAPSSLLPISIAELHLFGYLGCILALFKGQPAADWGYAFSVTSEGFPFSPTLENARKAVVRQSFVSVNEAGCIEPIQPEFESEFRVLTSLSTIAIRRKWLRTATQCALALPIGSIRYAINQTPGMSHSLHIHQARRLLEEDDIELLYDEYKAIHDIPGDQIDDILSPAVVWLSARVLRDGAVDNVA